MIKKFNEFIKESKNERYSEIIFDEPVFSSNNLDAVINAAMDDYGNGESGGEDIEIIDNRTGKVVWTTEGDATSLDELTNKVWDAIVSAGLGSSFIKPRMTDASESSFLTSNFEEDIENEEVGCIGIDDIDIVTDETGGEPIHSIFNNLFVTNGLDLDDFGVINLIIECNEEDIPDVYEGKPNAIVYSANEDEWKWERGDNIDDELLLKILKTITKVINPETKYK